MSPRSTPKRQRRRLARAELVAHLSMTAERWSAELAGAEPKCLPPEQWPDNDPMVLLASTYGLTFGDLSKLCRQLGDELEARACRIGYDEHWDAPPFAGDRRRAKGGAR